jgi:ubiquinol-cytochrome c reductase cytochrome b subunit
MKGWPVLAFLLACTTAGVASSRSQRTHGAAVFAESGCRHCHTIRNDGGGHKGPDLSGVGRRLTEAQMRRQILDGSKVMPSFSDDLQDTELTDLLAYLRSCRDKKKR